MSEQETKAETKTAEADNEAEGAAKEEESTAHFEPVVSSFHFKLTTEIEQQCQPLSHVHFYAKCVLNDFGLGCDSDLTLLLTFALNLNRYISSGKTRGS